MQTKSPFNGMGCSHGSEIVSTDASGMASAVTLYIAQKNICWLRSAHTNSLENW